MDRSSDSLRLSVVMPVLNNASTIAAQLEALAQQSYDGTWELIVSDNGCTDDTVAIARQYVDRIPNLCIVDSSDRRQVAHARNAGVMAAKGDYFLFCDGDDVVSPTWLAAMATSARHCGAVGGHLEEALLNDPVVRQWAAPRTGSGLPLIFGRLQFAHGANCGVSANAFEEVGGFDESFEGAGEEIDFFLRVQLAGYKLCWVPDAVVHYRLRSDLRGLARQWRKFGEANAYLYARFRHDGGQRSRVAPALRQIGFDVLYLPTVIGSRRRLGSWVMRVNYLAGQARGSWRHRVFRLGFAN